MNDLVKARPVLQDELRRLLAEESQIDSELSQYFGMIAGPKTKSTAKSNLSFASLDIASTVNKLEQSGPVFEAMQQDSKKLAAQVEDCRALSERLSSIVRLLDTKQIRAQQTLACTEDIINLKECKTKIIAAIEERNLSVAVSYLRQVHEIDVVAAKSSDDYEIIKEKEQVVKSMVQQEFASAISSSNIKSVMALCPLLQTLGLETEARDTFLDFVETTVFTAVSADASSVEGSTDAATAYAKSLSTVFNSAYVIIQQYLPMVIQGMENSLGDVFFLRRLHKRCEQEAGLVLKRYMKFRRIREVMAAIKAAGPTGNAPSVKLLATPAEMHTIMDELALMIQYCCRYAKYIKHVCAGAESKQRHRSAPALGATASASPTEPVVVFAGPTEFDKMVDELINKYYMEGEQWLMRMGVHRALTGHGPAAGTEASTSVADSMQLDECFFLLQKCGMRAVATNNIHAACAVLHLIADLISSDLLSQANALVNSAISQVGLVMVDHISKFKRGIASSNDDASASASAAGGVSAGFMNALSLASTTFRTDGGATDGSGVGAASGGIKLQEEGGFSLAGSAPSDPWGVAAAIDSFNVLEMCVRYTERLNKDIHGAAAMVFAAHDAPTASNEEAPSSSSGRHGKHGTGAGGGGSGKPTVTVNSQSSEMDKIKLCREDFEAAKMAFSNALRHSAEKLTQTAQGLMKDIFLATIGRTGPMGGIRFDEADSTFDAQPALNLLPRILCLPFETIVNICTFNLSERNKDIIVGLLADACCERLENFITQTTFRFAGALKLEEIVRSLSALFSRFSSVPVRGRFSRLREVMLVLTSDVASPAALMADSFTQLTASEVEAFLVLRVDAPAAPRKQAH